MKILILGDLPPFVLGGAEQQLLLLAQAWREANHQVLVLGHRTPSGMHQGVPSRRIRVAYRFGKFMRGLTFTLSLARALLREGKKYDVVYCRFLGEAAIVAVSMKAMGLLSLPLVVTPAASGEGVHSDINRLRASLFWPLWKFLLQRQVDAFNAISPAIHAELRQAGLGPTSDIPNGVRLPELERERSIPATDARFWLFCGRLVPQKGVDLLIEALSLMSAESIPLVIVGEGPEENELRDDCQRLELADRVTFQGRLPHSRLLEMMQRAYALILPSRYEGLSNAALEALALGLPVVSTRCGGIDAWLDPETGWVCEADPSSIAGALSATRVSPEEWESRSRRSRGLVEQTFAIERCAAEHLSLFARIAGLPSRSPDDMPPHSPRTSSPR